VESLAYELGVGVAGELGAAGWRRTRQVLTAAAVLPVLLRSWERTAPAVLPVTLTPFEARQLLKAARAELLTARLAPPAKPAGAYLAQAWNAAPAVPVKDGRGRADPLGNARGEKDLVGKAPGEKDPVGRPANRPGETVTPCCFRHVSKALSPAVDDVLAEADVVAALPPPPPLPQPASKNAPATTGSAARRSARRMLRGRTWTMGKTNSVPPFMVISSKGMSPSRRDWSG
jgi:hypothetical protein